MKRCFNKKDIQSKGSISLVIREMQIKTIMMSLHTPMRAAKLKKKKRTTENAVKDAENGPLIYCWWEYKNGPATLNDNLAVCCNLDIHLLCDPAIALLAFVLEK